MKIVYMISIILGIIFVAFILFVLFFFWNSSPFSNGAKAINKNLSDQYYYKKEDAVFVSHGNFFSLGVQEIENSDSESFQVLTYNLAKDKNNVYYNETTIEGADPETFELLFTTLYESNYTYGVYAKDAKRAFYLNKLIKEANAITFNHLWGDYSKDDKSLFYREIKFADITQDPFQIKNDATENYLGIGQNIYFEGSLIKGVNAQFFTSIDGSFSKDDHSVYYHNKFLEGTDPSSFEILNDSYQRDENKLYYQTFPIIKGDPGSYEFINTLYSKDKNYLYYLGQIVMDVIPKDYGLKQIEKLDNDPKLLKLSYDEHHTLFAKREENIKISEVHSLYKDEVYCLTVRVIGADSKTFKVFDDEGQLYAADKNQVYYHSKTVKGADLASFKVINYQFAEDKNHVYFFERYLLDIDPDTFVYQEGMYGETINENYDKLIYP